MRMKENFTKYQALSHCLMDDHFHLLQAVLRIAETELSDVGLLKQLAQGGFLTSQCLCDSRSTNSRADSLDFNF
jgi:hypothetical protein